WQLSDAWVCMGSIKAPEMRDPERAPMSGWFAG
ncbi:hypothetical protein FOVG_19790, partial [Fusarium oxysporum f. sp. pisi HDV247]